LIKKLGIICSKQIHQINLKVAIYLYIRKEKKGGTKIIATKIKAARLKEKINKSII
jgi:hypothetical protein